MMRDKNDGGFEFEPDLQQEPLHQHAGLKDDSGSRPAISSSSVLLPQPEGPRIATNSPLSTVRSISRRAVTERPPAPGHTFPTCRHESVVMARVATTRSGVGSAQAGHRPDSRSHPPCTFRAG